VVEIVVTREDANTDVALISQWLVEDGEQVRRGQPVCVVETTKASVEVEAPAAGALVHLRAEGAEVELGSAIGLVAENDAELAAAREGKGRAQPAAPAERSRKATRKAQELAERHGIDLGSIEKQGFVTAEDVERILAARRGGDAGDADPALAGVPIDGVTLPRHSDPAETAGTLDPEFLAALRADPGAVRPLASDEKCELYRRHGALVGDGVVLGEETLLVAPRIVLEDGVNLGARALVDCAEVFAAGALTHVGPDLEVRCRRAIFGENVHAGRSIRIGGGGHRDPWAVLTVGDLTFIGDEVFVNPCRPVLIGREVFLTQRAMLVTHNVGHSLLEGFENRFAPIVLEDRSQVGLAAVVYAGCRIGEQAIVGSNSYVVSDVPPGKLAIGVPARVAGDVQRQLSRSRQSELASRMLSELRELLSLRGHEVTALAGIDGFALQTDEGTWHVLFVDRYAGPDGLPPGPAGTVVLTLDRAHGDVPDGWAVLDLLERTIEGTGGQVVDTVREFCRKRGIRFSPGPWRYRGGLI
jgi:acetyltransferase-like isoleucine patch superfamily enzyme